MAALSRAPRTAKPDRPYSNGAVETLFDTITKQLWTQRFVFRNRARLELALRLMLLDLEGSADELRYRQAIRQGAARGRRPAPDGAPFARRP